MVYEVYVDSLFLVNFVMNLYLLLLLNRKMGGPATGLRILCGAFAGALCYCTSLFLPWIPTMLRLVLGTGGAGWGMVKIVFRPVTGKACLQLLESLTGVSFLLGGILFLLMRYLQGFTERTLGVAGILGAGGVLYIFLRFYMERREKNRNHLCRVELISGAHRVTVTALVDTGNGLREPISQKPVSLVDEEVLLQLWPEGLPELYRVIPYHSVGCAHGILKGYEVPEMVVEMRGVQNTLRKVYLGAGEQKMTAAGDYQMILHPQMTGVNCMNL